MEFTAEINNYFLEFSNFIQDAELTLNEYEVALFYDGLDVSDLKEINAILNRLRQLKYKYKLHLDSHISKRASFSKKDNRENYLYWKNVIQYDKYLHKELDDIMVRLYKIASSITKACVKIKERDFILENSSLLHLVSSNNHSKANIKRISDDAFLFNCQFHNESTSSMRVNSHSNTICCYGCGIKLNIFEYLREYEHIDYDHAKALLAAINNLDIPNELYSRDDEIVKHYQSAYNLRRYKARLTKGYKRASHKAKSLNNYLAMEKFNQSFATIERIKSGKVLKQNTEVQKKLKLEMPDFDTI